MAIAEGPGALGPLERVLPPDWAAVAVPSGMWSELDWSPLMGRRPIIVPENSQAGAAQAAKLEEYLRHVGIAASVLVVPAGFREGWRIEDGLQPGQSLFFEVPPVTAELGDMFSAADLDQIEYPPRVWVVPEWIPVGLTFLVGKSKIGKSWAALEIATEVAAGRPIFGRVATNQCPVLYLALEDGPERLQFRMRKILERNTVSPYLTFATAWPSLAKGCLERIGAFLDMVPTCKLVIVDILAHIRSDPDGRKGVYQQDYSDMIPLQKFARQRGIALILLHHTRKADASDELDMVSGSTGMVGCADTIMILSRKRGESLGKMLITGRDIVEEGDYAMEFNKEAAKWKLLGPAQQVKAETDTQRVYDLLLASAEPMKPADIVAEIGIKLNTLRPTLTRLKKRGGISQTKHGLWGITGRDYDKPKKKDD